MRAIAARGCTLKCSVGITPVNFRAARPSPWGLCCGRGRRGAHVAGHRDHMELKYAAPPIISTPPASAILPSTSCRTTTPNPAPTSGSRFTKIPARDASTRLRPQFHSRSRRPRHTSTPPPAGSLTRASYRRPSCSRARSTPPPHSMRRAQPTPLTEIALPRISPQRWCPTRNRPLPAQSLGIFEVCRVRVLSSSTEADAKDAPVHLLRRPRGG